jgi:hypothetical protein
MSFVLESKHIPPTGTKIVPVALDEKQLIKAIAKAKAKAEAKTTSASGAL